MGKVRLLPVCALLVLAVGVVSSLYVYATQVETTTISINGHAYTITQLFSLAEERSFSALNYSGVALDDIIVQAGVVNPEDHQYTIMGADGYQKTVNWENMKQGLLTWDGQSVFSDLPKAFRVKDVVNIEVE
jgi:hypothetical protein